jgi:hypothetical protein
VSDPTGERKKRQAGTVVAVAAAARDNIYAWEEGHFVHIHPALFLLLFFVE